MCVLGSDDGDGVDWVGVAEKVGSAKGGLLDGGAPVAVGTGVPKEDLPTISATDDEMRMEGRESGG